MKIDLSKIDTENFQVKEGMIGDEKMFLVQPKHMGCSYTKDALIFRSSMWNEQGELVSSGFKKFFNWGESADISPVPETLDNTNLILKIDGSLLVVSKYKGQWIHRTRGTFDAGSLPNGFEVAKLEYKYPLVYPFKGENDTWDFSLLFEWVSDKNQIIIKYENCPDFWLVGAINHKDYSLYSQQDLDIIAEKCCLKRPPRYHFENTLDMIKQVQEFKGKEGLVVYSNNDQVLHKVKGAEYLWLHHLKSELSSTEKILDVWLAWDRPDKQDFYDTVKTRFSFELAEYCKPNMEKICNIAMAVDTLIFEMTQFVNKEVKQFLTRKEQAQVIIENCKESFYRPFLFQKLDGKDIELDEPYKKMMLHIMDKNN